MEATPVTEPMRRPRASALAINAAAIGAILLRDIKRRAGPYYTGFLMLLLMPLAHLLIVVTAFRIFGCLAPQGTDQVVYFGISILPFVIYVYLSRQIVLSLAENRPLLYFNRVKIFDIFLARGILEAAGSVVVFLIFVCILAVYSNDFSPRDWAGIVFAVAATIYFSFAMGVSNALIAHVLPVWHLLSNLSMPGVLARLRHRFLSNRHSGPLRPVACLEPPAAVRRVDSLFILRGLSGQASQYSVPHHLCDGVSCRQLDRREIHEACASFKVNSNSSDHDQFAAAATKAASLKKGHCQR